MIRDRDVPKEIAHHIPDFSNVVAKHLSYWGQQNQNYNLVSQFFSYTVALWNNPDLKAADKDPHPDFWTSGTREISAITRSPSGGFAVRKRHSPEQIAQALRQAEAGTPVIEITRKLGVHENTFYTWKKRFGGLGTPEIRELRELRDENTKLKRLVADLSLDKTMLQDIISKKL